MKKIKTLIVGSESGIGKAITIRMTERFTVERETMTERRLSTPSRKELDVSRENSIIDYLADHGPFDQIVYTAGVPRLQWAKDLSMQDFIDDYTVNAFGFALLIGKHSMAWPHRAISAVAIVSESYKHAMRGSLTYCSSKAALASIIHGLARELAPLSRINGVAPVVVDDTPMTDYIDATVPGFRGWDASKAAAYEKSSLPMGRRTSKDEVAELVISVLNGPDYLTGSVISMNGGQ